MAAKETGVEGICAVCLRLLDWTAAELEAACHCPCPRRSNWEEEGAGVRELTPKLSLK